MAFQLPGGPRVPLQGESKSVVRWDLMRPKPGFVPAPVRPRPMSLSDILEAHAGINPDASEKTRDLLQYDFDQRHDLLSTTPSRVRKMAWEIAGRYGVEPYLIFGLTRTRRAVQARQELCYRLRQEGASLSHIARLTKRQDHTTIIYSIKAFRARRAAGQVPT